MGGFMDTSYGLTKRLMDKVLSARFIVTVLLASTLCYAVRESFRVIGMENIDKEIMSFRKEIFMYVMGMFSGIVSSVITSYFSRQDRKAPDGTTTETTEEK